MTLQIPKRFHSLDLIRGFAALSVVFWHWQHFFYNGSVMGSFDVQAMPFYSVFFVFYQAGWLAVDFFFALSGFIFFFLYADSIAAGKVKAWPFFVLRFSRLYPLHLLTFVFVLCLQQWIFATSGDYFVCEFNDFYHGVLNIFMLPGWGFERGPSFNGPVWSVSIEVLMYLLFFTVCSLGRLRKPAVVLMIVIGLVLIPLQLSLPGRGLISFFLGGLTFNFYRYVVRREKVRQLTPWVVAAAVLLWAASLLETQFDWFWPHVVMLLQAVLPERLDHLATAATHGATRFIIIAGLFPLTILALALVETIRGHLGSRLGLIGNLSYSSYLLHFPLQMVVSVVAGLLGVGHEFFYSDLSMVMFFAILIPLCALSFYTFEAPVQTYLRNLMLKRGQPHRAPVVG